MQILNWAAHASVQLCAACAQLPAPRLCRRNPKAKHSSYVTHAILQLADPVSRKGELQKMHHSLFVPWVDSYPPQLLRLLLRGIPPRCWACVSADAGAKSGSR